MTDWKKKWENNQDFIKERKNKFLSIDKVIFSPKTMLDIGCGLALVPEMFQKKYNTKLYLLDGDSKNNDELKFRDVSFGELISFRYYLEKSYLMKSFSDRKLNFEFIDADKSIIDLEIKFDMITSFKSCGFHYPLSSYKNLILKHSYEKTKLFFDIRKGTIPEDVRINNILYEDKKSILADIEFKS